MKNFWLELKKPILALAPMAGVTDAAFRLMCKHFGADVIYTEFASCDALIHGNQKTREMIAFEAVEQPVVCQLFGSDPKKFAVAAKILATLGFSGIDINFGCPAYKVVKEGGGVSLMRHPQLCREIIISTMKAVDLPVSIKIRAGISKQESKNTAREIMALSENSLRLNQVTALDLVKEISDLRVPAIMLHARSYEKPFDGQPNLEILKEVRKIYNGILLANGGIHRPADAAEMLKESDADGVGVARGAWGAPWIFKQIKNYLKNGQYRELSWPEKKTVMIRHAELALKKRGPHGLVELRKHLAWYVKGLNGGKNLRHQLVRVNTLAEVKKILNED